MTNSLKWLVLAPLTNLVGNVLGTMLALQHNLTAGFGGIIRGQDVLRDFLTLKGTALSAPLSFLVIPLGLIILALRPGKSTRIGVGGLLFVGAFYTIAQLGERIVLRVWSPGGFDPTQAVILFVNVTSAIACLFLGFGRGEQCRHPCPSQVSSSPWCRSFCPPLMRSRIIMLFGT